MQLNFFAEMEEKFGAHVHILDWALHLDEGTPHIHERHVFDCKNKYGELCPQQEKALEELGLPLPNPDKKKGRNNNRKQTFDAECRKMLFRICAKYNLHLQTEPSYGGRGYLEKQDFIIENQKEKLSVQKSILSENEQVIEKQAALEAVTMKLADMETLVDEVAGQAYEKACEVVTDTVRQQTQKEDIKILDDYSKWLSAPERTDNEKMRQYAVRRLETLKEKFV